VALLLGLYHVLRLLGVAAAPRLLRYWLHAQLLLRVAEAALFHLAGIGYSPLFFYHFEPAAMRIAVERAWPIMAMAVVMIAAADRELRRVFVSGPGASRPLTRGLNTVAVVLLLACGSRAAIVLYQQRARLPQNFADASLIANLRSYASLRYGVERVSLSAVERRRLEVLGVSLGSGEPTVTAKPPARPDNIITIYLEGFQANFTESGGTPFRGLTPNLDRFAAESEVYDSFYNGTTPTINALVSSQCGILSNVENGDLDIDRGYTRNLTCLSDLLHGAGYHQVFLDGADSGFSGKRAFLTAHHYDDIWGWEQWRTSQAYRSRRHQWGIHDTDLIREAIVHLREMQLQAPFHLTLLTANTHEPGYVAPDCPEYRSGRRVLNAIHCTDFAIGLLLDALRQTPEMDHTVIVMMGDHMMPPTADSAAQLGPAAAGWFGKVFMAVHRPHQTPVATYTPAYTPDFAPIVLSALGFRDVGGFPLGRLPASGSVARRTLVTRQFEVRNDRMIPSRPDPASPCSSVLAARTTVTGGSAALTDCERERIVDSVDATLIKVVPAAEKGE
jgi:hypothetical protein